MKMYKYVLCAVGLLLCSSQLWALDKNQINLDQQFWGTWSVYNSKSKCTENYSFEKPGKFSYSSRQKKMVGEFAVLRSKNSLELDVLAMKVVSDNHQPGCGGQVVDYTGADIRLSLKWLSGRAAELCTDQRGKKCTGLVMIKP